MAAERARGRRRLALALWGLSSAAAWAAADIEPLTHVCASCHGDRGISETEYMPSLAGQPEFFLFDQLFYIREGVRVVPQMVDFVQGLTDADIDALAKYFSSVEAVLTGPAPDARLVEKGAAIAQARRCGSCHGADLAGREAVPRIAKQRVDYLTYALGTYRDGERKGADTTMNAAVHGLSDQELEALAHYAASR